MRKNLNYSSLKNRKGGGKAATGVGDRGNLEKKAIAGAKKAVKEYKRVFDRLREYDRTEKR